MIKKVFILAYALLGFVLVTNSFAQSNSMNEVSLRAYRNPSTPPFISAWDNVPAEIKNRNAFKRLKWFYRPRLNELGIFPKEFIDEQKEIELSKIQSDNGNSLYQWTNIGPVGIDFIGDYMVPHWGIVSGRVRGLAVHPANPAIVYAGAGGGGIWKSINGGQTWIDKSGGMNMITFGSIAIDPSNPEVIYAGTGEYVWVLTERFYSGDGLYKSTNGGDNWVKINAEFGIVTHFTDVAVSPHNPNIVMSAIAVNLQNAGPNCGIWRSSNAGINWTRILSMEGAWDVAFHPTNPGIVYAASGSVNSEAGFYISTDAGLTFSKSNTGLPPSNRIGRIQFDVSQSDPSVIYSVIYDTIPVSGGFKSCAYKSVNGGTSWTQISQGVNIAGSGDGITVSDQGFYDLCIAVNPVNPNNVFLGNMELSSSLNGSTFSFIRNPNAPGGGTVAYDDYTHVDHHIIKFAPSNPSIIYVGCDGGVFKSTNGGQTFFCSNTGLNTFQLYRAGSHPSNPDILLSGTQDNGTATTNNRGATPYKLEILGDGIDCFYDYSNPNIIFIGTFCGSMNRSTNGGQNWSEVSQLSSPDSSEFLAPYWQHPVNPDIIYGGVKRKLCKSTNKGDTWSFTTSSAISSNDIYSAVQSPVNTNNMIVISHYGPSCIYRSSDEGYTWTDISPGIIPFGGNKLMRIQADPLNGNTFYLLKNSYTGTLVLKTTNFGNNWTDISSDLPKVPVNDFFVDELNSGVMFLGNDFGVYRTTNSGANWSRLNNGFPFFVPVIDFSYFKNGGTRLLRAATFGRSIYELNLNQPIFVNDPSGKIPLTYNLSQNYPNPFNPVTKINFDLPADSKITLIVYDVTGREVAKLLNNELRKAGYYTIDFNGSNFSSGAYFYRFIAETAGRQTVMSKRMVLIR